MSRAAWAIRAVGVWVAGLAVAGTATIAAEPSMPGLPPLPPDPSTGGHPAPS